MPGRQRAQKAPTCKRNSTASDRGVGVKKAIVAVAASILAAVYHMLKNGTMYQDLGPNHFDRRNKERQKNRLVQRLAELGFAVQLAPLPN